MFLGSAAEPTREPDYPTASPSSSGGVSRAPFDGNGGRVIATFLKLALACLAAAYLLTSWAALNQNQNSIKGLSKAYGFLLGQEYTLKRIGSNYPALRLQVETARLTFGTSFSGVKEKIEQELVQGLGEANFQKARRELENKLTQFLRQQPLTAELASQFLDRVKARAKGVDMEADVLSYLLAVKYAQAPVTEFLDGFRQRFNTDGSGKAQGIKLTLQLPRSWLAQEAERPHIVQKWTSEGGTGMSIVMLDIRDAEGYNPTDREIDQLVKSGEARKTLTDSGKVYDVGTFSVERRPGFWAELSKIEERTGLRMYQRWMQYQLFFRGKAIGVMCLTGASDSESLKADAAISLIKPLCLQVVNSLVLEQAY